MITVVFLKRLGCRTQNQPFNSLLSVHRPSFASWLLVVIGPVPVSLNKPNTIGSNRNPSDSESILSDVRQNGFLLVEEIRTLLCIWNNNPVRIRMIDSLYLYVSLYCGHPSLLKSRWCLLWSMPGNDKVVMNIRYNDHSLLFWNYKSHGVYD